jgi:hypothetical protein
MRSIIIPICAGFLLLYQLSGCDSKDEVDNFFRDPDPGAIESTLKTTIPVGYAASLAMNAMAGDVAPNVTVVNGCSTYPCNGMLYIDYDETTYPMPIETNSNGEIIVVGLWTDQNTAILSVFFTNINLYTGTFILENVDIFPALRIGNQTKAVYADIEVNTGSNPIFPLNLTSDEISSELDRLNTTLPTDEHVSVEEEAWIVDVDNNGTSGDFSDDLYVITGAGQFVGASPSSASIDQVIFLEVRMSHACLLNPTNGVSILNEIEVSADQTIYGLTLGTAFITFHSECNGTAEITAAIGSYIGSFGDSLTLNLSP